MQLNQSHQGSKIISDYYAEQQAQRTKKKLQSKVSEQVTQQLVIRQGKWTEKQHNKIKQTIKSAFKRYPQNLQQQANFIHFHLEDYLGKRVQVIIYEHNCNQGHCLFAIDAKYIEFQYEGNIYLVWKVKLIQEIENKEY